MVLLFKPEHVPLILGGKKAQTRRLWKTCRVRVGGRYQCRTKLLDKGSTFAVVEIDRIRQQPLWAISEADARAEGYASADEFIEAFCRINHTTRKAALHTLVWVIDFHVVEVVDHDT